MICIRHSFHRVAYVKQDSSNSQELPASFVLQLAQPLPTSVHIAKCLYKISTKGMKNVYEYATNDVWICNFIPESGSHTFHFGLISYPLYTLPHQLFLS